MDNIKKELADLIRAKSDDELLEAVLNRKPAVLVTKPVVSSLRSAGSAPAVDNDWQNDVPDLVGEVYMAVRDNDGVSISDIVGIVGAPRSAVRRAVTSLMKRQVVYRGGSRATTRYATRQEVADRASEVAGNGKS